MFKFTIDPESIAAIEAMPLEEIRRMMQRSWRLAAERFGLLPPLADEETVLEFGDLTACDDTVLEAE